jgi:pyruvate formate-lyase activating enzyme-like uncharacterized protein
MPPSFDPCVPSGLHLLPMASSYRGPLATGCEECKEGRKMVLFVTGRCRFRCFYCPVSERRNQLDVTYANEREVHADSDVIEEAEAMGASGTGITGGDPLGVLPRTVHYLELLKGTFGKRHHVHLYTHEPNPEKVEALARAGLDEFRLHIPPYLWGGLEGRGRAYRNTLLRARELGMRQGVEVPVVPGHLRELRALIHALEELPVDFVNLNELEFSPTNERKLWAEGFQGNPRGWGVRGSRREAEALVREGSWTVPIHFCSSGFKDSVQLRERLKRRAARTARPFQRITRDGTLVMGIVELPHGEADLPRVLRALGGPPGPGKDTYVVDLARRRVVLGAERLRGLARRLPFPAFEVELYPTADPLEVERSPLNDAAFSPKPSDGT